MRIIAFTFAALVGISSLVATASAQQTWVNGYYRSPPGQGCGGFGCNGR
jgi:hypothetical protein